MPLPDHAPLMAAGLHARNFTLAAPAYVIQLAQRGLCRFRVTDGAVYVSRQPGDYRDPYPYLLDSLIEPSASGEARVPASGGGQTALGVLDVIDKEAAQAGLTDPRAKQASSTAMWLGFGWAALCVVSSVRWPIWVVVVAAIGGVALINLAGMLLAPGPLLPRGRAQREEWDALAARPPDGAPAAELADLLPLALVASPEPGAWLAAYATAHPDGIDWLDWPRSWPQHEAARTALQAVVRALTEYFEPHHPAAASGA
jgi:hypothetical protein